MYLVVVIHHLAFQLSEHNASRTGPNVKLDEKQHQLWHYLTYQAHVLAGSGIVSCNHDFRTYDRCDDESATDCKVSFIGEMDTGRIYLQSFNMATGEHWRVETFGIDEVLERWLVF
jgi:hypothetical protein